MERNTWRTGYIRLTTALLLSVLAFGCDSKDEKIVKHLQKATQYVEEREFERAAVEFNSVVQLDAANERGYQGLGEVYLELKQDGKAFQSFTHVVSINPNNLKAQLKLGQLYLHAKKVEEAREKVDLVLARSSNNVDALALLAGIQFYHNNKDSAQKTLEKALSLDPNNFLTYFWLGRLLHSKGDLDGSETAFLKALCIEPSSNMAYMELAKVYEEMGQRQKAQYQLEKMIQISGSDYKVLNLLASFYERAERWDQAEKTFLEAINLRPKDDTTSLMALGGYYARRNEYQKALKIMLRAAAIHKDDLNLQAGIANLHFDFKNMGAAEAAVNKILKKDKRHVVANFLKGRLYLLKKDYDQGLKRFALVIRERPDHEMAYYFRAQCLLAKGERGQAQNDLAKAVELNPELLDARLMLSDLYLRERKRDLALRHIEAVLEKYPDHVRALMLKGNVKLQGRDFDGAEAAFNRVVQLDPLYAPGYVGLGNLYRLAGREEESLRSLKKALQADPQRRDVLGLMVDIYIRDERFEEALKVCEDYREGMGKDPSVLGFVEYLEGKVFVAKWQTKKAQQQFEKAIQDDPNNIVPYEALARLFLKEDKFDEAVLRYQTVLRKYPKHLDMYMVLGTIYDLERDREKAQTYYRKALEVEKGFAPAANNLAWNLAEMGGHIDEALAFAQIAKEKMPRDPRVMDTLGWVHFLRGSYKDAAEEFQDSLALDPDNPTTYYHLGLAYYKNNQLDAAREVLETALEINRDFQGAEEASSILQEIGGSVPLPREKVARRASLEDTGGVYGALQEIKGTTQPVQKRPTDLRGLKQEEKEVSSGSFPLDELP